jgi:hypothetical protein
MQRQVNCIREPKQGRLKWSAPILCRLQAGSAEFQQTNGTDNFTANS